jgi:hypothetical protein
VNQTVRQYLVELEQQNPTEEPVHEQEQVSTTDPDATYATKDGTTAARMSQESVAAQDMIARFAEWQGREPVSVAADATYGNGKFLQWLMERGITPYICGLGTAFSARTVRFTVRPFHLSSREQQLSLSRRPATQLGGRSARNRTNIYIGTRKRCGACSQKAQCTRGQIRYLVIHMNETARQRARNLTNTPSFANAQRERKKEGRGAVRGTQKSDRTSSSASTEIKVCPRAVLPGSGRTKH